MDNLIWGIPLARQKREEKYDFPVLTMKAEGEKGTARKFELNDSAIEMLMVAPGEDNVSFAFINDEVLITNVTKNNIEALESYQVNKSKSFSNKKLYDFIAKFMGLNTSVDVEFKLNRVDLSSNFKLEVIPCDAEGAKSEPEISDVVVQNDSDIESADNSTSNSVVEEPQAEVPAPFEAANFIG